jgi:hypothetical protein
MNYYEDRRREVEADLVRRLRPSLPQEPVRQAESRDRLVRRLKLRLA